MGNVEVPENWHPVKTEDTVRAPISVLIVDDYEPFRRFVCSTIRKQANLLIVAEAPDGAEAIQQAAAFRPDLIVLDIGLPKMNGIEAARAIREIVPDSKIVFLTQESSPEVVEEALNLGARGYVFKMNGENELLGALEAVVLGNKFVSSTLQVQVSEHT